MKHGAQRRTWHETARSLHSSGAQSWETLLHPLQSWLQPQPSLQPSHQRCSASHQTNTLQQNKRCLLTRDEPWDLHDREHLVFLPWRVSNVEGNCMNVRLGEDESFNTAVLVPARKSPGSFHSVPSRAPPLGVPVGNLLSQKTALAAHHLHGGTGGTSTFQTGLQTGTRQTLSAASAPEARRLHTL